ncbi:MULTISPECIES: NB-ARC domain-containing protein [unclassified Crossiella]|uniref:NB-ARC domain-containing protein n=1 Tax=unclassified Crossiella TaxID=2620835 RepID=UPI001FFE72E9|nr:MULTISPECIES: NB-ARC domain-containing protein [unclassified Crossiella]MCK2239171.1 NB-ARC domain-containing protein [Crossiella sp. S99.2]MCK2251260.1 NB-ARC domain-containing protein [Crossiella sp. S99.1]
MGAQPPESGENEETGATPPVPPPSAHNDLSGHIYGGAVQGYRIGPVNFHQVPGQRHQVPRQLPPAPAWLVHRGDELATLDRLAEGYRHDGRSMVAVLSGLSGVGKTAIALQWAHQNLARFGGGQLYADLNEYRHRGAVDVNEVLAGFLRALGEHRPLPIRLPERAAKFRTMTAESNVLVLLDNADQPGQVRAFQPGSPAGVVLVTSRSKLSGLGSEGAELIPVHPLDPAHSVELLLEQTRRGNAEYEQAMLEVLAELCAGLPMALRVVGALLARRRHWSPQRLVDHFSDERHRLNRLSSRDRDPFGRLFADAAGQLSTDGRAIYHCVGVHPGPDFGQHVLAAATGLTPEAVEDALDELSEAHLVEVTGPDRYRMHELVKLHAGQSAPPAAGHAEVLRGIVDWYRHGAAAADRAVLGADRWRLAPRSETAPTFVFAEGSGTGWFELERRNLLAVVRCAAGQRWDEVVWQLCEALWPAYHTRQHFADSIAAHQLGVAAAERCGHLTAETRMRNQLARAWLELAEFAAAERELEEAQTRAAASGEPRARAVVVESYGVLRSRQNRLAESAGHFRQALGINEEIGDVRGIAMQGYQLGGVLQRLGEHTEAIAVIQQALLKFYQVGDEFSAARARIVLGDAHVALGQDRQACVELQVAVRIMRMRGQPEREVRALQALVEIAGRLADAELRQIALDRLRELTGGTASDLR